MKAYLLFEAHDFDFDAALPSNHEDLIQDLEVPTLLAAMAQGDKFLHNVAVRVLLANLEDPGEIHFRQSVLADCLAHSEIVREIYAIAVGALEEKRGLWGYSSHYPGAVLSGAVNQLAAFVVWLKELRKVADTNLTRFESTGMRTLLSTLQRELDDEYFERVDYHLKQLKFRDGQLISMELARNNSGIDYVLRFSGRPRGAWKDRLGLGRRRSYSFTIPPRDEGGARVLSDMTSRGINLVANAAAQSADHILSYFTMLRAELGFYIGCINLRDQLASKMEPVAFPDVAPWSDGVLNCTNLRDVSLALRSEEQVVGNEVDADGKSLVVVTGANSGGKSTFLRSLGQAQLMAQCGLFVAADTFRTSASRGVFTHFIREEDATMTSGRLDEELGRMSRIADNIRPGSLMLFNESFAATNEREGSEIGRQVVKALLEVDVRVCFVSHQYDFAESFNSERGDSTLFLRAPRGKGGRRSFKLEVAEPLPTSFGEDIYRRLGGWLMEDDLVGPVDETPSGLVGAGGADQPVSKA